MNSNNLTMLRDFNRNASNINMPEVFEENVYKIIDITR